MENNEVPWTMNGGRPLESPPEWAVGFIYVIVHKIPLDGYMKEVVYVGKKILVSSRRKRIGVREKAATKTRKTFKVEKKDSGWADYWGSSNSLKQARMTGEGTWRRMIVQWCYSKKNMSYEETKWQFELQVMSKPSYNDHIGNWYKHDTDRQLYAEYRQKQAEKPRKPRIKKGIVA